MIFHLRIPEVTPATTPLDQLAELLRKLSMTLTETVALSAPDSGRSQISLIGISQGSNDLAFQLDDSLIPTYQEIAGSLATSDFSRIPTLQHKKLLDLEKLLKINGWSAILDANVEYGIPRAEISLSNPIPPMSSRRLVSGNAELFGQCIQVGGVKPKVKIKLANGKLIPSQTTIPVAKEVATHLYEDVFVSGEAKWDANSWLIVEFQLKALKAYNLPTPIMAFQKLASLVGSAWRGIDASGYVQELRYGEEAT